LFTDLHILATLATYKLFNMSIHLENLRKQAMLPAIERYRIQEWIANFHELYEKASIAMYKNEFMLI
jgi:hypothetical protein